MRPHEIEFRVLQALELLRDGLPVPQASISPFPKWPKANGATARRLAAEANTARGRDLLWIIGADAAGKVRGAEIKQFREWWEALLPFFDSLAPEIAPLSIPADGDKKVVALAIQTVRAPFLIIKSSKEGFAGDVPWIDSGTVRTARRSELISILSPLQDLPNFEILEAEVSAWRTHSLPFAPKIAFRWSLDVTVYVVPKGEVRIVVPFHRCKAEIGIVETSFRSAGSELTLTPDKNSTAVRATESALMIEGLGRFFVFCCGQCKESDLPFRRSLVVRFDLLPSGATRSASIEAHCLPAEPKEANQIARWRL